MGGDPLKVALVMTLASIAFAAPAPKAKAKKVTLDGKPAMLDFKASAARKRAAGKAEVVKGEIANTDVINNTLSVKTEGKTVTYAVPEGTTIRREPAGKRGDAVGLDALQIGDAVEVYSADGRTALSIQARTTR